MSVQSHFKNIEGILLSELENAQEQIVVAVAWLTNQKLLDLLCDKAKDFVDVQLLIVKDEINLNSGCDFELFTKAGGQLHWQDNINSSLMHHKFCVIDKKTVITGSYNWTNRATTNYENVTVIKDEPIVATDFFNQFISLVPYFSEAIFFDSDFESAEYFDTHEKRLEWFTSIPEEWQTTLLYYADELADVERYDSTLDLVYSETNSYEVRLESIFKIKKIICSHSSSLTPLKHLTALEEICCIGYNGDDPCVTDISPLKNLIHLKEFVAPGNRIENLKPLANLKKLERLDLGSNLLDNLSGIGNLKKLTNVDISNNNISSLRELFNCTNLIDFRFANNEINNIDFLRNNLKLKRVEFHNNLVTDILCLSNCSCLENITFYNNQVKKIAQLTTLMNLKYFYPFGNPILDEEMKEFKKKSKAFISDFHD